MNELDSLIDFYTNRLKTSKLEMDVNFGKMKYGRIQSKVSCYKVFLNDLIRLKQILSDENKTTKED